MWRIAPNYWRPRPATGCGACPTNTRPEAGGSKRFRAAAPRTAPLAATGLRLPSFNFTAGPPCPRRVAFKERPPTRMRLVAYKAHVWLSHHPGERRVDLGTIEVTPKPEHDV